jgi:hypothetical protein
MPGPKWDGKLYKPMRFGAGLEPGTVEWERERRRRRAQAEHWREVKRQEPPPPTTSRLVTRVFKTVFKILFRIR